MQGDGRQAPRRKTGFVDTFQAVGASFFGVRGRRSHERDLAGLDPVRVVIAGLLAAAAFVLVLVMIARMAAG
ncbi:MAG TPA: DUF2970 domain-containing protein [Burkholderiaceae bacterium]|nr:DUF2970 domain-containing protein [Burkholderiaceae bacterium]